MVNKKFHFYFWSGLVVLLLLSASYLNQAIKDIEKEKIIIQNNSPLGRVASPEFTKGRCIREKVRLPQAIKDSSFFIGIAFATYQRKVKGRIEFTLKQNDQKVVANISMSQIRDNELCYLYYPQNTFVPGEATLILTSTEGLPEKTVMAWLNTKNLTTFAEIDGKKINGELISAIFLPADKTTNIVFLILRIFLVFVTAAAGYSLFLYFIYRS